MADEREQALAVHAARMAQGDVDHACGRCFNAGYDAAVARAEQAEALVAALREALESANAWVLAVLRVVYANREQWEKEDFVLAVVLENAANEGYGDPWQPPQGKWLVLADTEATAEAARKRIGLAAVRVFVDRVLTRWRDQSEPLNARNVVMAEFAAMEADRG